ncbi:hypothetical protein PQX77_003147, partial [Marasmius sp. AFHP31]
PLTVLRRRSNTVNLVSRGSVSVRNNSSRLQSPPPAVPSPRSPSPTPPSPPPPLPQEPCPDDATLDGRPPLPALPDCILAARSSPVDEIQTNAEFIYLLSEATLKQSGMPAEDIQRLRNPRPMSLDILQDPAFQHCFRTFCTAPSAKSYKEHQDAYTARHPNEKYYSHYDIEQLIEELTGVVPLKSDMCIDSHIGFTGKFEALESCPYCGKSRYDKKKLRRGKKVPVRQFITIPIAFVLQALFGSTETAREMQYFLERLATLSQEIHNISKIPVCLYRQ